MATLRKTDIDDNTILITRQYSNYGLGCAIAFQKFLDDHEIMGTAVYFVNSNKVNLPDVTGRNVILAGIGFDRATMEDLYSKAKNLIVIDHHETAQEHLEGLDFGILDQDKLSSQLLWEWLFNEPEPKLLEYMDDRDLWTLPSSREFSAGLGVLPSGDIRDNYKYYLTEKGINNTISIGGNVLTYQYEVLHS